MHIQFWQAILIGIIYYLSINGTPWLSLLGSTVLARPLICGTLVGVVLGNPVQGCIYGAAISLPFLAYISAGGSMPMDPGFAGTLGTAFAMASRVSARIAITLAVPIGLLGTLIWIAHMTVDITFLHMIDRAADEANPRKVAFWQTIAPQIFLFIIAVIPATLAVFYGADAITNLLNALKGTPMHVLNVIGGVLPALGVAMILQSINNKQLLIYYFLGVMLAEYFKLPIIAISIVAFILAFMYTQLQFSNADTEGDQ